ncbi:MAG: imidazoleglycerol-phosphate dehydratase HisB [Lachnospiraceae bacterium]|nr:imidazoleglycerol-phosphate dehydratase HisB [Lachnospiraceae bacterium]
MRIGEIVRETAETEIELSVDLDGSGDSTVDTGVGFFDHMLTLFSRHSRFDLNVKCDGDTYVDAHHSVEDIGICLGKAFAQALGERRGINRYGHIILPMDETLILCAVDISGRACLCFEADFPSEKIGSFDTELVEEFMAAFVRSSGVTLHVKQISGKNSHHIAEGMFKALGRTLKQAAAIDEELGDEIPSTKGVL